MLDALAALDEAANEVVTSSSTLTELQELFGDMQAVVDALSATLVEAVKSFVSEFNLFDLVALPTYRDGVTTPGEWWWFDAMHYRKTGKLAKRLLDAAPPDSPLHLYAIGYLTHVAADTVGHPYVNAISGGPYRSHAQRHKASENYQDVFNFSAVKSRRLQLLQAARALQLQLRPGRSIPRTTSRTPGRTCPRTSRDDRGRAQRDLRRGRRRRPFPDYAKRLDPRDVNDAYRLWYRWFKSATDTGTLPPPVPYSLTEELREVGTRWSRTSTGSATSWRTPPTRPATSASGASSSSWPR